MQVSVCALLRALTRCIANQMPTVMKHNPNTMKPTMTVTVLQSQPQSNAASMQLPSISTAMPSHTPHRKRLPPSGHSEVGRA